MNPKVSITIDAKNKAIATVSGMLTVGADVDIELNGMPDGIPSWPEGEPWSGPSARLRIVDSCGHDLVRYPSAEGDGWSESFETVDGHPADFDTDRLRCVFHGVPFNESVELGVIVDSVIDKAQYAVGKVKVRQWSAASTEDPTVLPDWRETLAKLKSDLGNVEQAKDEAVAAAGNAVTKAGEAATSAIGALTSERNAKAHEDNAFIAAKRAEDAKAFVDNAKEYADASEASAARAAEYESHYPMVVDGNLKVWEGGAWVDKGPVRGPGGVPGKDGDTPYIKDGTWWIGSVDTGVKAVGTDGVDGDPGNDGITPHIGKNGNWFFGDVDTGVKVRGDKGDPGEVTEKQLSSELALKQDKLSQKQLSNIENAITDQSLFDAAGAAASVEARLDELIRRKQDSLKSGENVKTINGESILGSGNIKVKGEGAGSWDDIKPEGGVPKSDLASVVQSSLDNADNAIVKDGVGGLGSQPNKGVSFTLRPAPGALGGSTVNFSSSAVTKSSGGNSPVGSITYSMWDWLKLGAVGIGTWIAEFFRLKTDNICHKDEFGEWSKPDGPIVVGGVERTFNNNKPRYIGNTWEWLDDTRCSWWGPESETAVEGTFQCDDDVMVEFNSTRRVVAKSGQSYVTPSGIEDATKVNSVAVTELHDRDCSVVAYAAGMTITFAASTRLRSCEVLITGCTAGTELNVTATKLRGDSDALTLEDGDNHLTFAEYATGEFFVTRHVANEI